MAWIALAPWLATSRPTTRGASLARAAVLGAIVTSTLALGMSLWLPGVIVHSFGGTRAGALGLWLLGGAAAAPGGAMLGLALQLVPFESRLFPLWAGSVWAACELSLARVFPELPWLVLGATQIDTTLASAAAVIGVHGVSALVVSANTLIAQALCRVPLQRTAASLAMVVVPGIGSVVWGRALLDQSPREGAVRVAVIQPSSPLGGRETPEVREVRLATLLELTARLPDVDLIVWPESAARALGLLRGRVQRLPAALALISRAVAARRARKEHSGGTNRKASSIA
jgi:apolipoprotein N-acyltransferase